MTDLSKISKNLKAERVRLMAELDNLEIKVGPSDERREGSPFGKREEEADEAMELEKRLALERHLSELLIEVNRALEKIKAGSYGICDNCNKPVEPARLEALTHANLCLKCKVNQMKDLKMRFAH